MLIYEINPELEKIKRKKKKKLNRKIKWKKKQVPA